MSPIQIIPEIPITISKTSLPSSPRGAPSREPFTAGGVFYVRPEGMPLHYEVKVFGFPNAPGGILESERLTPGYTKDELTLTTPEDSELARELGVSLIRIDRVIYEAVNP